MVVVGAGLVGGASAAHAADSYSFDTGSGLVVTINATNGNLTSLRHRGTELAASGQAAGQFESGWSSATVTQQKFDAGSSVLWSATNSGITQYYFLRRGDNTVYLATNVGASIGEGRFIARLSSALLPVSPTPARTGGATTTVEGSDVFAFPDGHTASKFYSSQRLIVQQPFGAHAPAHGVYILPGTQEMNSGGPFFRDIEVNDTGSVTNITAYLFSGHTQTEGLRQGLHGPYAMVVTDGAVAAGKDLGFLSAYIPGLLANTQRGTVSGTASGSWNGLPTTVALSGSTGQYWGKTTSGAFTISRVKPGTYTATLYAGELAVASRSVSVSAGRTSTMTLSGNTPARGTLFQIGTWDGTPAGFLNSEKIETMHPSDIRMSSWRVSTFASSASPSGFPMALFKDVNSGVKVTFPLTSVPTNGARLRIGSTLAFAGGRPAVTVGTWSSPSGASPAPLDLNSRGVTRGTWRGNNTTYTFTIPASVLTVGTNTVTINVISGSSGAGYLSPNFVVDAVSLDPA